MKIFTKILCSFTASVLLILNPSGIYGQLNEVDFLKGGVDDANILFEQYLTPFGNVLGADINGGWYNTAKPHKLGGFDITFTASMAWAPKGAKYFDISRIGLDSDVYGHNSDFETPTVMAPKEDDRPDLWYWTDNPATPASDTISLARYQLPNGTGLGFFPLPMAQVGIGLFKGTDVTVRYLPNIKFGDYGQMGLWGIGLKHSVSQYIPFIKIIPFLDISLQGGYTTVNTSANIDFQPADALPSTYQGNDLTTDAVSFDDQSVDLNIEGYTINLIASQSFPVISFYEGVGYSKTKTVLKTVGYFPVPSLDADPSSDYFGEVVVTDEDALKDPINLEMRNASDLRINAGFRLKFAVVTIHFDYTYANYSVFTTGLGVSFR